MTTKLTSNNLIEHESKSLVNVATEALKQWMGATEYFSGIRQFEEGRRKTKEDNVAR